MIALYVSVLSLFIAIVLVPILAHWAVPLGLVDRPDPRKIHEGVIPRIGGIAITVATIVSLLVWVPLGPIVLGFLVGGMVIFVFGVADDRCDLDYRIKFAAQFAAALLFVWISGIQITRVPFGYEGVMPGWLGLPLTVIAIIGITNAINLSDGMDGLAGGTALIVAGVLGYLAYEGDDLVTALVALSLMGAILGFLRYNTFPARVFMGDAGSQFLGFGVAVLGLVLIEESNRQLSPLVPVLVLGLPILDTLYVMVRRVRAGRSPFSPDRQHLHHRLLDANLSQYEALLVVYGLQLLLIVTAWTLRYASDILLLIAYLAFSVGLLYLLNWWHSHHTSGRALARRLDFVNQLVELLKAKDVLRRLGRTGVIYGVSVLFLFVPLWVNDVPVDVGWLALLVALALVVAFLPLRNLPRTGMYRLAAFVAVMLTLYLIEQIGMRGVEESIGTRWYLAFIAFSLALWLRFGAIEGFRINGLDILVILVIAIVPNMPLVREYGVGLLLIEALLLFYACELILTETAARGAIFRTALLISLLIVAVRGLLPLF